jgi:hypothetical protein
VPLREFIDEHGRHWTVWDVHPTLAERRQRNEGPPPGVRERRRFVEQRVRIRSGMSSGWLAFEAQDGERRRLIPIPDLPRGWDAAADDVLRTWLTTAELVSPKRRLSE